MGEKESTSFGKGEVRKDNPPSSSTTKSIGKTAVNGAGGR